MNFSKEWFKEILLAVLFLGTLALIVHLIHKSDAGGRDEAFIVWAEAQAAVILTTLITLLTGRATVQDQAKNLSSIKSPDPNDQVKGDQEK